MSATPGKSKLEIQAERKAKKKNKAALKNQSKVKIVDQVLTQGNQEKNDEKSSDIGDGIQQTVLESASPDQSLVKSFKELDLKKTTTPEATKPDGNILQKTREEIIAEREAKRLAKQAAKDRQKKEKISVPPKDETDSSARKIVENQVSDMRINKNIPDNKGTEPEKQLVENETKSKAQLRAERRALQEAQRAKKLEKSTSVTETKQTESPKGAQIVVKKPKAQPVAHRVKLFAHLYHDLPDCKDSNVRVHPSILRLGTQFSSGVISGANVRCLALLNALKTVITEYEPQNQEFSRGLEGELTKSMCYLNKSRPVAVSMINAVKHLKYQISHVKGTDMESKSQLKEWIDTYIKEQLETAAVAICMFVKEKITNNDVILTYGCSSLIQRILITAHKENIKFRVIVVDGRPWLEGREMLRKLVSVGIHCTYIFVNGLSFIMPEVTKVLLGAHALLANGYVMSRAGSSQIALLAKAYNVPVLVCCETHKFSERVQTDAFVYNELGDPDDLVSNKGCLSKELTSWKSIPYLTPLNLKYDVTPPDLVSAVVTEIAVLPCTSVPVILRIKPPEVSC